MSALGFRAPAARQPARPADPRGIIAALTLALALALRITSPAEGAIIAAGVLLSAWRAKRLGALVRFLRHLLVPMALFALVAGISAGPLAGVLAAGRLMVLAAIGWIGGGLINPLALCSALQRWRVPPQYAYLLVGTLAALPQLEQQRQDIWEAQISRGIRLDSWRLVRNGMALFGPLIVATVLMAEQLALVLESRGFGHQRWTDMHPAGFSPSSWGGAALFALIHALWPLFGHA